NHGRVTMRHQGGGHKHHLRLIDFRRNKDGIAAKVERLEYDPIRSAHIALLLYADGERRYVLAAKGVQVGAQLMSGAEAPIKAGNTLPLRNIPIGTEVHCVEMHPIDHPHGGGEGRTAAAQPPVSPWGVQSKGFKTRRNKRTQVMIVRDRRVK